MRREENKELGTVDYVQDVKGKKKETRKHCILRIHPETEKGRLVLQIGTSDATRALKATQAVIKDIDAVDINMCCPKHFSISGGMGVALTRRPEIASDVIKTLRRNLNIPVSCKLRMLDEESGKSIENILSEAKVKKKKRKRGRKNTDNGTYLNPSNLPAALRDTREFIRNMESSGACAVAVHMRTASERRAQRAHLETESLKFLSDSVTIPFIVNGDIFTKENLKRVREILPNCSVMFARGALRNASVFRKDEKLLPVKQCIEDYLRESLRFDNHYQNSKYVVQKMMKLNGMCGMENKQWKSLMDSRSMEDICAAFDMSAETLRKGRVVREYLPNHLYSDSYFDNVVSTKEEV